MATYAANLATCVANLATCVANFAVHMVNSEDRAASLADRAWSSESAEELSSQPIAQTLEKKRVPFFVVTGHLKPSRLPPPLNAVEIVAKPYRDPQMIECLRRLAKAATNGGDMRVSESARDLAARD